MKDGTGSEITVEVDESAVHDFGGFGTLYEIAQDPDFVVKRIELTPAQPLGSIPRYVAHIRTTRDRLLSIKREEEGRERPRQFIVDSIDKIVDRSLSTHWYFDRTGMEIGAVWFRQKRAPGKSLIRLFKDPSPPASTRVMIARDLITRMRTLRRADLVHLDCVADNIFVDNTSVTVIDLDGVGIVRRNARGQSDEWDHRPLTLGKLKLVRPPPWYPQVGIELGPKSGNYLFGERWVVVDTVIRILTWNKFSALSWVEPRIRKKLIDGHATVGRNLEAANTQGLAVAGRAWTREYETVLTNLRGGVTALPDFEVPAGHPPCLRRFANLAQSACVDPRLLASGTGSPYDTYLDWLQAI